MSDRDRALVETVRDLLDGKAFPLEHHADQTARAILEGVADALDDADYVSQGTYPYCEGNCARWLREQARPRDE